jgi:hypothetical protein
MILKEAKDYNQKEKYKIWVPNDRISEKEEEYIKSRSNNQSQFNQN